MSAHTPGPWALTRGLTVYKRGDTGSERIIAEMGWGPQSAQGVADAHLIAAAPDLLAALIELEDIVIRNGLAHSKRARAAIARATGEK